MKISYVSRFATILLLSLCCSDEGPITGYRAIPIVQAGVEVGGVVRTYTLQIPSAYDGTTALPLVIGLHGNARNADGLGFMEWGAWDRKGEQEGFIGVYPDGLRFLNSGNNGWNAGSKLEQWSGGRDDVGFVAALIAELQGSYTIDPDKIFVVGSSGGAWMAYRLAAELSEAIAAIAAVSGQMILEEVNVPEPVAIIHVHGLADPVVPFEGVPNPGNGIIVPSVPSVMERWVGINRCASVPDTVLATTKVTGLKWPALEGHGDVVLYTIQDWPHLWPLLPGFLATEVIWEFFAGAGEEVRFARGRVDSAPLCFGGRPKSLGAWPKSDNTLLSLLRMQGSPNPGALAGRFLHWRQE